MTKLTLVLLVMSAASAAAGQIMLKIGAHGRTVILEFFNAATVTGLALYAVGVVIWIYVLSIEKLVTVYAFTALTFVLVYLGGAMILKEQISRSAIFGVGLILLGLYLIARSGSQT